MNSNERRQFGRMYARILSGENVTARPHTRKAALLKCVRKQMTPRPLLLYPVLDFGGVRKNVRKMSVEVAPVKWTPVIILPSVDKPKPTVDHLTQATKQEPVPKEPTFLESLWQEPSPLPLEPTPLQTLWQGIKNLASKLVGHKQETTVV